MSASIAVAFVLGLASTLHCWGMCGGILAAFSLGIPGSTPLPRRSLFIAGFNTGRILSYGLAGGVAGTAGSALLWLPWRGPLYLGLQLLAGLLLFLSALRLGGWLVSGSLLERRGARLWSRLQPYCGALLPVDRLWRALALGALWGWIPCGLVYSALAWSAATAEAARGALSMLAFGAGTLPGMIGAGLAGARLGTRFAGRGWRRGLALLLALIAVMGPLASWHHAGHGPAQHRHGDPPRGDSR